MQVSRQSFTVFAVSVLSCFVLPCAAAQTTVRNHVVDCDKGEAIGPILSNALPGETIAVTGLCRENLLIQPEVLRVTLDGQGGATIQPNNAKTPAVQILGREITIKGFTVDGGSFGIAVNRDATATVERNVILNSGMSGIEVSHNSFGRIIGNTVRNAGFHGILVLGSASAHIGILRTDDRVPIPNVIENNRGNGIWVMRASTARIIGNELTQNSDNGIAIEQVSHADVAGNVISGNGGSAIRVVGNSGVNLADSAMRLFEQPNVSRSPNMLFGVQCKLGAYVSGPIGTLTGRRGAFDRADPSCVVRGIE